jgi:acetyl-CoA synthetase
MLETLKLLAVSGPLAGRRMASISCSGGEAALVADAAASLGMELPPFDAGQEQRLRATLGPLVHVANPLDYHTFIWGNRDAQRECFSAVLAGDQDVTVKVFDYPSPAISETRDWDSAVDALMDCAREASGPAVVISTLPENLPVQVREKMLNNGIAPLQGLQEGMRALKAAMDIGEWFAGGVTPLPVTVFNGIAGDIATVGEWQAKSDLNHFGVAIPEGQLADADSLLSAADAIGYPVVLKSAAGGLIHKSDAGGVVVDVRDAEQLQRAAHGMQSLGSRFLIEAMVPGAVAELLVGVTRDPQFGLALTVGSGGSLVELMADSRTLLFPLTRDAVVEALDALKVAPLLAGYRGAPPGDRPAAIDAILAVAAYAEAHAGRLEELDINPLLVLPQGRGAVAVDALIRLREEREE